MFKNKNYIYQEKKDLELYKHFMNKLFKYVLEKDDNIIYNKLGWCHYV